MDFSVSKSSRETKGYRSCVSQQTLLSSCPKLHRYLSTRFGFLRKEADTHEKREREREGDFLNERF